MDTVIVDIVDFFYLLMLWIASIYTSFLRHPFKYTQNLKKQKLLQVVFNSRLVEENVSRHQGGFLWFQMHQWGRSVSTRGHGFENRRLHIRVYSCIVLFPSRTEVPAYWYRRIAETVSLTHLSCAACFVTLRGLTTFWTFLS